MRRLRQSIAKRFASHHTRYGGTDMSTDQPVTSGFLSLGDGQIWYEASGTGHPLVLVHAGWVDRRMWDEQVAEFGQDYRVIRYDMRGFGRSTLGNQPYCHADDLAALLQH